MFESLAYLFFCINLSLSETSCLMHHSSPNIEDFMNYQQMLEQAQNSYNQGQMPTFERLDKEFNLKAVEQDNPDLLIALANKMQYGRQYEEVFGHLLNFYKTMQSKNPNGIQLLAERTRLNKQRIYDRLMAQDLQDTRIPANELKDLIVKEQRRGEKKIKLDFCPFKDLLEKHYNFSSHGIYDKAEHDSREEILKEAFGMSEETIYQAMRISPLESEEAAIISILSDGTEHLHEYLNHWHYMLDYHFMDFRRGGDNYMGVYSMDDDLYEPKDKPVHPLFRKIDMIYFSEARNYIKDDEYILFTVDW
jgi:hypothetical protein